MRTQGEEKDDVLPMLTLRSTLRPAWPVVGPNWPVVLLALTLRLRSTLRRAPTPPTLALAVRAVSVCQSLAGLDVLAGSADVALLLRE